MLVVPVLERVPARGQERVLELAVPVPVQEQALVRVQVLHLHHRLPAMAP